MAALCELVKLDARNKRATATNADADADQRESALARQRTRKRVVKRVDRPGDLGLPTADEALVVHVAPTTREARRVDARALLRADLDGSLEGEESAPERVVEMAHAVADGARARCQTQDALERAELADVALKHERKKRRKYTSQYMGVSRQKKRWLAKYRPGKSGRVFLGTFEDEKEAARAYDAHVRPLGRPVNFAFGAAVEAAQARARDDERSAAAAARSAAIAAKAAKARIHYSRRDAPADQRRYRSGRLVWKGKAAYQRKNRSSGDDYQRKYRSSQKGKEAQRKAQEAPQEVLIATPEGAMLDVTTAFHEMQLEQLPIPEQPPASRERRATYPDDALRFPASGNLRFPAKPLPSSPKSVTDTLDAMAPPPPPLKLDGDGAPVGPSSAPPGRSVDELISELTARPTADGIDLTALRSGL
ncbi:hypothetical protein JL722_10019 [Aureococcus anophagefferens]|nr:hypothetical protein JL722_10019 [Aureococcus anophagefferens]